MAQKRLSDEETVEMLAMLMAGAKQEDCAQKFGVSRQAINQRLQREGVAKDLLRSVLHRRQDKIEAGLIKSIDQVLKDVEHPEYASRAHAADRVIRLARMLQQSLGQPILTGDPEKAPTVVNNMQANVAGGGAVINLSTLVRIAEGEVQDGN